MHDAQAFYDLHVEKLGDSLFNFRGNRYQFDLENAQLNLVASAWSENIFWIGDAFFEMIDAVSSDASIEKKRIKPVT